MAMQVSLGSEKEFFVGGGRGLRCSGAPFAASIKLDMPGKDILGSSGDEGCDILRYVVYAVGEEYWCGKQRGDTVSAITLRKQGWGIDLRAPAE